MYKAFYFLIIFSVCNIVGCNKNEAPTSTSSSETPAVIPPVEANSIRVVGRHKRVGDEVHFAWPGVYFEGRFSGPEVGLVFGDSNSQVYGLTQYFDVSIDGKHHSVLDNPQRLQWIKGLSDVEHLIRISKRNETPALTSVFKGIVAGQNSHILAPPQASAKRFIFIGDSFTAGYGLESKSRECSEAEIQSHSNSTATFAAITASNFAADYQINAVSGRGLVRNFNGTEGPTMDTLYNKVFPQPGAEDLIQDQPADVVVIGLGINDFSTPVQAQEKWTQESLKQAYQRAYHQLLDGVREIYGDSPYIVLSTVSIGDSPFVELVQETVKQRMEKGDKRILTWVYGGLSLKGCDWHPSAKDHKQLAEGLTGLLKPHLTN